MEIKWEFKKSGSSFHGKPGFHARSILLILCCLPVLLAGCAHTPEMVANCEPYGVQESHSPMGTWAHLEALGRDELAVRCAGADEANMATGSQISGCVIPHPNGVVEAYYWAGDTCAMNHELCHFRHGSAHTERYLHELAAGIPMPYCPKNQLKG